MVTALHKLPVQYLRCVQPHEHPWTIFEADGLRENTRLQGYHIWAPACLSASGCNRTCAALLSHFPRACPLLPWWYCSYCALRPASGQLRWLWSRMRPWQAPLCMLSTAVAPEALDLRTCRVLPAPYAGPGLGTFICHFPTCHLPLFTNLYPVEAEAGAWPTRSRDVLYNQPPAESR